MIHRKKSSNPPLQVFRGEQIRASYHEEISIYRGNPLIEALPPIWTEDEVMERLEVYPEFDERERKLPAHQRLHLIQNVLELLILMTPHLDLEQRFSRMIRAGYIARNPVVKGFWQDVSERVESLGISQRNNRCHRRSTATGFTILGLSGVGKSTAVQGILDLYPQVIYHNRYCGKNHTSTQLVWLKLECPADGSIKGLCLNFFQAVDDILGTSYYETYGGKGRRTVNEMMPYVARVASNVHLGVLVIDEIQSLTKLRIGGYEKMLDFFVQLINTIGLPVVLVGTYKAWSILGSEFRQIRRGTGQGDFIWDRMQQDENWQLFIEGLWRYQYVLKPCQLTAKLNHALYYECQGITDFAVKIFMLAQARAITTGLEQLTVGIIKSVAKDCLRTAREVIDALKSGSLERLTSCEDVRPIDIECFLEQQYHQLSVDNLPTGLSVTEDSSTNSQKETHSPAFPQPCNLSALGSESTKDQNNVSTPAKKMTSKSSNKSLSETHKEKSLPEIVVRGEQDGICAYEALHKAGYIRPATEYL